MRQLRRILRLHHEGASAREIVRAAGVARSTVQDALKRATTAKLSWPLPDGLTDEELEAQLFAKSGTRVGAGVRKRQEPDWAHLVHELRRPAVTMVILWEEYRKIWPDGYSLISLWACDLLTSTSTPYAAAWYRKTSLTFSDAIGAVRLQFWVGDINSHSPPHREPQIIPPSRLVRMANALCFAI